VKDACSHLRDRLYPLPESRDPVIHFVRELGGRVTRDALVLDIGAGSGSRNPYDIRGRVRRVIGVDVDRRVGGNGLLDQGVIGDITHLPFAAETFDVAFSIYVLEHIQEPARFVDELHRILKPGGCFLALTPNRWHYVGMIARCTPLWFHAYVNQRRGRPTVDTFDTFYRLNSRSQLRRNFLGRGFRELGLRTIEVCPHYLAFSAPTLILGALYERIVNSSVLFAPFRVNLLPVFQKLN